jgi:hypothetical protein
VSTTNPTWSDTGSNPGRRGGKPATNRLRYGAAYMYVYSMGGPHTALAPRPSLIYCA